jgi:hypothetical protein
MINWSSNWGLLGRLPEVWTTDMVQQRLDSALLLPPPPPAPTRPLEFGSSLFTYFHYYVQHGESHDDVVSASAKELSIPDTLPYVLPQNMWVACIPSSINLFMYVYIQNIRLSVLIASVFVE